MSLVQMSPLPGAFWEIITKHRGLAYGEYVRNVVINDKKEDYYCYVDLWFGNATHISACIAELDKVFTLGANPNEEDEPKSEKKHDYEPCMGIFHTYLRTHAFLEVDKRVFTLTFVLSPDRLPVDDFTINQVTYDGKETKGPVDDAKAYRYRILPGYKAYVEAILDKGIGLIYEDFVTGPIAQLTRQGYHQIPDPEVTKDLETLKGRTWHT